MEVKLLRLTCELLGLVTDATIQLLLLILQQRILFFKFRYQLQKQRALGQEEGFSQRALVFKQRTLSSKGSNSTSISLQ